MELTDKVRGNQIENESLWDKIRKKEYSLADAVRKRKDKVGKTKK